MCNVNIDTVIPDRWQQITEHGEIINDSSIDLIQYPWQATLDTLCTNINSALPDIVSVYVRGSVARGTSIIGKSDLDLVVVTKSILNNRKPSEFDSRRSIAKSIAAINSCPGPIDICYVNQDDLCEFKKNRRLLFLLKTQGLCLLGDDVVENIPAPKLSEAHVEYNLLSESIESVVEILKTATANDTKNICRWIQKVIVRAGFELVMEHYRRYTRDISLCVEAFIQHHAERASQMRAARELVIDPIPYGKDVAFLVESLGQWILSQNPMREGRSVN